MCAIQRVNGQDKKCLLTGYGSRCQAHRSVSKTAMLLGFSHSTVSCVYQEWSSTQRTSSQLDTTMWSIGVNMGQHPCRMLSTPCRVHASMNCGCSEGKAGWGGRCHVGIDGSTPRCHPLLVRLLKGVTQLRTVSKPMTPTWTLQVNMIGSWLPIICYTSFPHSEKCSYIQNCTFFWSHDHDPCPWRKQKNTPNGPMNAEPALGSTRLPGYDTWFHFLNSVPLFSEPRLPDSTGPKYVIPCSFLQGTVATFITVWYFIICGYSLFRCDLSLLYLHSLITTILEIIC